MKFSSLEIFVIVIYLCILFYIFSRKKQLTKFKTFLIILSLCIFSYGVYIKYRNRNCGDEQMKQFIFNLLPLLDENNINEINKLKTEFLNICPYIKRKGMEDLINNEFIGKCNELKKEYQNKGAKSIQDYLLSGCPGDIKDPLITFKFKF